MSEIELEAGQWYQTRDAGIVYCVGRKPEKARHAYPWVICDASGSSLSYLDGGFYSIATKEHGRDIIEHLPNCTGFDWEPPKPVVAPDGWRLLTEGETILATDQWWNGRFWDELGEAITVGNEWSAISNTPIARKIEPKYRRFNWDEREQLRGKWIRNKVDKCELLITQLFNAAGMLRSYGNDAEALLRDWEFLDGSPVGVLDE